MTKTKATVTLIERDDGPGLYGINCTAAIVEHSALGRLYISQMFGGIDTLAGGTYRWGLGCQILPADTLASLQDTRWNGNGCNLLSAMTNGYDDSRPVLGMDGRYWGYWTIGRIAAAAGL